MVLLNITNVTHVTDAVYQCVTHWYTASVQNITATQAVKIANILSNSKNVDEQIAAGALSAIKHSVVG